jgi:YggT family protein
MEMLFNVFANLIQALATVSDMILKLMMLLIFVRAIISWFSPDPYNPLVQFLQRVTEPILAPIRRLIPMLSLGIDISPIIAFFAIVFLQTFLVQTLYQLASYLRSF